MTALSTPGKYADSQPDKSTQCGRQKPRITDPTELFWRHVLVGASERGCWLWIAAVGKRGYGHFTHGSRKTAYKHEKAHRYLWKTLFGPIPQGLNVLHSCDVRRCVNPKHLFLGTGQDNMDDMTSKNRQWSILTPESVVEIRNKRAAGESWVNLGKVFNVSKTTAKNAAQGKTWAHLKEGAIQLPGAPAYEDITGQQFGDQKVIKRAFSKKGRIYWSCKCEKCGTEKSLDTSFLRSGKPCGGCYRKTLDLTSKQFGHWTVLYRDSVDERRNIIWMCECDCVNKTRCQISSNGLKFGSPKHCGHQDHLQDIGAQ